MFFCKENFDVVFYSMYSIFVGDGEGERGETEIAEGMEIER